METACRVGQVFTAIANIKFSNAFDFTSNSSYILILAHSVVSVETDRWRTRERGNRGGGS